jgi:hypothetical protein
MLKEGEKYGSWERAHCSVKLIKRSRARVNNDYSIRELIRLGLLSPACVAEDILHRFLEFSVRITILLN